MATSEKVKEIITQFHDDRTLPAVAIKVTKLINSPDSSIREFEEIISLDPVLLTRLLRYVNSPMFSLVSRVDSISKAVVMVGMKELRNLVAVETVKTIFMSSDLDPPGLSRKDLWAHSATTAIVSRMVAQRIFEQDGEDAFLAGILHDIGMIAEMQVESMSFSKLCSSYMSGPGEIIEYENSILGTNHTKVGTAICKDWNLDKGVMDAIRNHHNKKREYPLDSLTAILQIADYISCRLKYSMIKEKYDRVSPFIGQHMKDMASYYKILVKDVPAEIAKAGELYDLE
jgi:putative nucleotidyltransferase with HDIG domain